MRDYELKRGHWKHIDGEKLLHLIQDVFQENPEKEGEGWTLKNWGAFKKLYVEQLGKKHVRVDTEMNPDVPQEEQMKTLRTWNDFLELVTGYNAKQRSKKAQEAVKGASD